MNEMRVQEHVAYDYSLFVKPTALDWFYDKIEEWLNVWRWYRKSERMVIGFTGSHGCGKTWLLKHLQKHNGKAMLLAPLYFDLEEVATIDNTQVIRSTINVLLNQLDGKGPTLLLDNVPPPPLLEPLKSFEYDVLRPCLMAGACVVMTLSTTTRICWHSTRLQAIDTCPIETFNLSKTKSQLDKLDSQFSAEETYQQSGGLPYLNYLLHSRGNQAFDIYLDYLLSHIPIPDRNRVQHYLNLVCLLDRLEDKLITKVLNEIPTTLNVYPFEVRNELVKYELAEYKNGIDSLVLRDAVKYAVQDRLKKESPSFYDSITRLLQRQ
jgi:hypothetical protein